MYFIGASVITRGSHFFNSIDSIFLKLEKIPYIFFLLASWQKGERKYSEIRISKSHSSKSHSGYFLNEPVCRAVVGRLAASTHTCGPPYLFLSLPTAPPPPHRRPHNVSPRWGSVSIRAVCLHVGTGGFQQHCF